MELKLEASLKVCVKNRWAAKSPPTPCNQVITPSPTSRKQEVWPKEDELEKLQSVKDPDIMEGEDEVSLKES